MLTLSCALCFSECFNCWGKNLNRDVFYCFADFTSAPFSFCLFICYLPVFFVWQRGVFHLGRILWKLEGRCRPCYLCWMNVIPRWLKLWGEQQHRRMQFTVWPDTVMVWCQLMANFLHLWPTVWWSSLTAPADPECKIWLDFFISILTTKVINEVVRQATLHTGLP